MSAKFTDSSWALYSSYGGRVREHRESSGLVWFNGSVFTVHGIVLVYSDNSYSTYDFARDGIVHHREERVSRTQRGLTIQATKFAASVSESPTTTEETHNG